MLYTYKIATLNINGITSPFNNLLFRQDIYIALLQKVSINDFSSLHGYAALVNERNDKRGTAILLKEGIFLSNIKRLPSGRGIAGLFKQTWSMNIYAPSGAKKRKERNTFFTHDLVYLLPCKFKRF